MSDEKHPIRNSVIAGLILALILWLIPGLWVWLKSGVAWVYSLSISAINIPAWLLAIMVIFSVPTLLLAARSLRWRFSSNRPIFSSRSKSTEGKTRFLPISPLRGIGNSYLNSRYIGLPSGDVVIWGGAQFQLKPDSLIFDTSEHISYYSPRKDGGKEIDYQLPEPANRVKSVHFLINSGNSLDPRVSLGE